MSPGLRRAAGLGAFGVGGQADGFRGHKDRINIRIPRSGVQTQDKGSPESMVCRILMLWAPVVLDVCAWW